MHPVNFLFEDIYRNHWGIPEGKPGKRASLPMGLRHSVFRKKNAGG